MEGAGTVVFLPYSDNAYMADKNITSLIRTWTHGAHEVTCTEPGVGWMFNANTLHWGRGNRSVDQHRILLNVTLGSSQDTDITENRSHINNAPNQNTKKPKR